MYNVFRKNDQSKNDINSLSIAEDRSNVAFNFPKEQLRIVRWEAKFRFARVSTFEKDGNLSLDILQDLDWIIFM